MKPFYRPLVRESWRLSRAHLFLWPLALCASFIGLGIGGTFQILFDITDGQNSAINIANTFGSDFITSSLLGWNQSFELIPWGNLNWQDAPYLLLFFGLLAVVIALIIIFVSSEGGLIHALSNLQNKKKAGYLTSFRVGVDKFWHLLGIYLVYLILYLVLLTLVILPLYYLSYTLAPAPRLLLQLVVYLILIPAAVIANLVTRYGLMYIILHNNRITEAFRNAWLLFRANWIISLETAVLAFAILFAAFLLFSVVIVPVITFLFVMFGSMVSFSLTAVYIVIACMLITLLIIVAGFATVFTVFQMSLWVGVFNRISVKEHHSKIHRLTRHLPWLHRRVL